MISDEGNVERMQLFEGWSLLGSELVGALAKIVDADAKETAPAPVAADGDALSLIASHPVCLSLSVFSHCVVYCLRHTVLTQMLLLVVTPFLPSSVHAAGHEAHLQLQLNEAIRLAAVIRAQASDTANAHRAATLVLQAKQAAAAAESEALRAQLQDQQLESSSVAASVNSSPRQLVQFLSCSLLNVPPDSSWFLIASTELSSCILLRSLSTLLSNSGELKH